MESTLRYRKILQAANHFCRASGLKSVGVSHLPEKLQGDRALTWADLDAIQAIVPDDPNLRAYWYSALCSSPVAPVTAHVQEDGEPMQSVLPASHPPLFPPPTGAMRKAA